MQKRGMEQLARLERLETRLYCPQIRRAVARMSETERKNVCRNLMEEFQELEGAPAPSPARPAWGHPS